MKQSPRLLGTVECLEDRSLPSGFGTPWADATHLTLSFAPDGTPLVVGVNSLGETLSLAGAPAQWQREILRAFQTWAVHANINIGLVADGGQAFGITGAVQGDSRFGDIRVGAGPLDSGAVAGASPFSWTGSTLSGDLLFNAVPFGMGNNPAAYDLFSVALHEAGHSLGLDGSNDLNSSMFAHYRYQTALTAADIAALQTLYGVRQADSFEGSRDNDAMGRAATLRGTLNGLSTRFVADADITTASDVDFYKFSVLTLGRTDVTVRLQAEGLSLLTSRVTVYDSAGRVVASGVANDPLSNDLVLSFRTSGLLGGTYYVRVAGATDDVFGIGGYRLTVDSGALGSGLPLLGPLVIPLVDNLLNNTLATATKLLPLSTNEPDPRFDVHYRAAIESAKDTDFYQIRTPLSNAGGTTNLNIIVWGLDANPLDPRIRIYDAAGNRVAFQVLANDAGVMSIQIAGVPANTLYSIQVSARTPGDTGAYFLGADFNTNAPTTPDWLGGATLSQAAPTDTGSLTVTEAGIYQFFLAADTLGGAGGFVTMTLTDAAGNVVLTQTVEAGEPPVTAIRYLEAGAYTISVIGYTAGGQLVDALSYDLYLLKLSDNVGPYSPNTTDPSVRPPMSPPVSPPPPPPTHTSPPAPLPPPPAPTSPPRPETPPPPPPTSSPGYTYTGTTTAPPPKPTYYSF